MPPLLLIPFAVFFCCCLAQFPLLRGIRTALAERHPDVWREISTKSWFIDNAVSRYVWGNRAKALNDPDLMQAVNRLRLLYAVAFAAWLALLAVMFTVPTAGR
jgi:hypothetical protein